MRLGKGALLALAIGTVASAQTNPAEFPAQVLLKYPKIATLHSLALDGSAQWIAGSLHESGTATLQASNDGSSTLQLNLGTASRTETRTTLGSSRTCQWTDAQKAVHPIEGPDCEAAVPWFAPMLLVQPAAALTNLSVADAGTVLRNGVPLHAVSYAISGPVKSAAVGKLLADASRMTVLYDPQTLLPSSVEYSIHADKDLHTAFKVRVVFSDYQTESGLPIPHRIDRYVNNTLQLSITVMNSSVN